MDHSPLALVSWTHPEFRIQQWNARATQLFGWSFEEVRGLNPRDWPFVHEADVGAVGEMMSRLVRGDEHWNISRNRNYRKDGSVAHCEWYNSALRDASGRLVCILSQVLDVTDRHQALSQLEETERRFKATFEQAAVGIAHVGVDGRWQRVNARLCDIIGYSHQELMGLTFQDITHPEDLERDLELVQRVLTGNLSTYSMEKRYIHKSGRLVWINLTVSLVRKADGTPDYFISVIEDISRRRLAESERDLLLAREQRARTEAEELVRRRSAELEAARSALVQAERLATAGQLAAGVGHEINNPLAYVLANVTFALEELAELGLPSDRVQEMQQALQQAKKGAERIRNVVGDLRTFARANPETLGPVDVRAALEFSLAMAAHQLRHRAQIVRHYEPVPPVLGNESRLGQVFLNLLLNAAHALPEGASAENRVTLTLQERAEGQVAIEVRDTGRGIAAEHLPRIFEPFFTTKPVGEGTGLGLSVCHGIVTGLGGQIEVESTPGQGSTFRVLLPISTLSALERMADERTASVPRPETPRHVLIVDNEPEVLDALARLIGPPHLVERAETGMAVLELLAKGADYDVIFCDLMIPDLTGMDLHDVIAAQRPELLGRMVFMTAGGYTPRALEFLKHTAARHLAKPFDPEAVRAFL
jgi:PAS domain S-box-containing protein